MPAIKIPGADSIESVAPQRDPGVTATPDDFGAQIGTSEAHFGDTLSSLGAHMYKKLQSDTSDTWVQTHNIDSAVAITQAQYDNRAAFPQGDQDGGTAAQDDLRRRIQQAQDTVTARTTARLGEPTAEAQSRVNATLAGRAQDALVQGLTFGHNQQVIAKQNVLGDNVDLIASRVMSRNMPLDEALKTVDANAESGKPLYSASQLADVKEKWQHKVIDAAIKSEYDAGNKAGGDALADQYYGRVPRYGESNAAGVTKVANDLGIAPRDLAAVMSYETGGKFSPTMMGGKGGNYQGLIQFGPAERAQYGVKPGQSFQDQLPAVENFLRDRGVKPGMGLAQIYSVVNAGSLDQNGQPRWASSDGNGNIASHVQNIQRDHYANADKFLAGAGAGGVKLANADGGVSGSADEDTSTGSTTGGSEPVLPNVEKANYWRSQSKSVGIDLDRQEKLQAMADKRASKEAEDSYLQDWFSDAPKTNVQNMMLDKRLSVPDKLQLRAVGERQLKDDPLAKTSGVVTSKLIDRMRLPEGSPDKISDTKPIYDAYVKEQLTKADFKFAMEQFSAGAGDDATPLGKRRTSFIKNAGNAIEMANMGSSMNGGAGTFQKYNFEQYVAEAEKNYRAEKKNPDNLYNPLHPDYLGKLDNTGRPAILKPFLKDAQTNAREEAATITPAVVAPTPDNAASRKRLDDWLRNRGGAPFPTASTSPVAPTSE